MATDNYLKVRRPGTFRAVEFFFESRHEASRVSALHAAQAFAGEITARARDKEADAEAAAITVWQHGVAGLGDLHCVGGCDVCAPRAEDPVATELARAAYEASGPDKQWTELKQKDRDIWIERVRAEESVA